MNKFVIIPDSTCDMTFEMMKRFNIKELVSGTISFSNNQSQDVMSGNWNSISSKDFYDLLKKSNITTGAPSPEKFINVFEKYLKEGYDVLSISISSALSSTFSYATKAAEELNKKYPNNKVVCLDSKRYSTAELLLIIHACKLQSENKSIDETFTELEKIKYCLHQAGPMDDLMFLASKKRISNGKAFMGTLAGINPIGEVSRDGLTSVLCKVKGSKKALLVSLEYMKKTIINPQDQIIVIAHSNRKEKALLYKEMIESKICPKEIIFTEVGPSCAPNIGPGLCAAYYYGKEISDDLSDEKKIFDSIIRK